MDAFRGAAWVLFLLTAPLSSGCEVFDPCDDKVCGDSCQICDPEDTECVESAVPKSCNRNGVCTSAQPPGCG